MTLLHRQAEGRVRATVVSLNSWVAQPAGAIGTLVLAFVAQEASISTAMLVGGVILAVAAPLYLPAWRQSRMDTRLNGGSGERGGQVLGVDDVQAADRAG